MPGQGPYPALRETFIVSGTGVTSPVPAHQAKDYTVGCSSSAGHNVFAEGSLDGAEWSALRWKGTTNPTTIALTGTTVMLRPVIEYVHYLRFNVTSMTAASTLTLWMYGVPLGV